MEKKKYQVKDELEFLLAKNQLEKEEAEKMLEEIRSDDGAYYQEKTAVKLVDFLCKEEARLRVLIDIKKNLPELFDVIKRQKPYIEDLLQRAKTEWSQIGSDSDNE